MKLNIGFIGVGKMGSGMASRLLKNGYPLVVYDVSEAAAARMVNLGAKKVDTPKELAEKSEIIISSLPGPRELEEVYLGKNGVLKGAKKGSIIIEVSTVDPQTSKKIAEEASKIGVRMLDAPVSGSPKLAAEGELTFMVGGDKQTFQECEELLRILGKTVHHVGEFGSGNAVKLVNNMMSMGNVLVAAEAFILGVKAGVDPDVLFNVLSTSRGRSAHFVERFPTKVLKGDFSPSFTTDFACKDLALALEVGKALKIPLPVTSLVLQIYTAASAIGLGGEDFVSVIKLFEQYAGVKARSKS